MLSFQKAKVIYFLKSYGMFIIIIVDTLVATNLLLVWDVGLTSIHRNYVARVAIVLVMPLG